MRCVLISISLLLTIQLFAQISSEDSLVIWKDIRNTEAIEFEKPTEAILRYKDIYNRSLQLDYLEGAFVSVLYTGVVYTNIAQYDSSLVYLDKAEKINIEIGSELNKAKVSLNRANSFMFKREIDKSIEQHYIGIAILEELKDSLRLGSAYSNLSSVYQDLDDWDKQIEFLEKSLGITPKDDLSGRVLTLCDLVLPYLMKDDKQNAKKYCVQCDSLAKVVDQPYVSFFASRNTGEYYLFTEDYPKAIDYYKVAVNIAEKSNYDYYLNDLYLGIGDALLNINRLEEGKEYLTKSLRFAREKESIELEKKATFLLAVLEERQGNYKKAVSLMLKHDTLKDSLINVKNIAIVAEANSKYEAVKKEKELVEKEMEIQLNKSRMKMLYILIASLLCGSILLFLFFNQRQKRIQHQVEVIQQEQQVRSLESLMEGEEKERMRIAKELHDGVNGDLSAIKYKLSSLVKMNNEVIADVVEMIDTSCKQVRAISHNLIPPSLQDFNLIEAVQNYCETKNEIHKENISFTYIGEEVKIAKKIEVNILRIIQELVMNSIKHGESDNIDVQVSCRNGNMEITVEDDGKGYDVNNQIKKGIGLRNIKSRIEYLNASLNVKSDSEGTSNIIEIDFKNQT